MKKKPNIILLMTDQLRGDCLGYAGHPDVKTPYLDTLASRGIFFDHAYSACPSCIAARASLHTGMAQDHHRRVGYEDGIPWEYEHTLAGELTKAGYHTYCVGKMHVSPLRNYLGYQNVELCDGYFHAARYGSVPWRESQKQADDYFHWLKQEKGIDADVTDTGLECNSWVARPWIYEEKYHPTNWVTDRSIDFLRRKDPDRPFFLTVSYLRPHPPFDAPAYYFDLYRDKEIREPAMGNWEDTSLLEKQGRVFDSKCGPVDKELIRQAQIGYYACITHLDHQIGRLIQALVEYEEYDNTLILFTSDHGEELCDHHFFRKSRPYEGSSRIPLIISGNPDILPGIRQGEFCHSLVELRDIMPTLLDFAGMEIPDTVDGRSILPMVSDPSVTIRDALHCEHAYGDDSCQWIVTPEDKYIWYTVTGKEQYFRMDTDRRELRDEINNEKYASRIKCLRNILIRHLESRQEGFVSDGKLVPGREYRPYISF